MRKALTVPVLALAGPARRRCDRRRGPVAAGRPVGHPGLRLHAASLPLGMKGMLTIGTDNPAYPPWFGGGEMKGSKWKINDPTNGKGFESAVAYAVAKQLGFAAAEVEWIGRAVRPGRSPRARRASTSTSTRSRSPPSARRTSTSARPYYDVNQAVVALKGTPIAKADARSRPEGRQARRPDRHHELRRHQRT